MTNLRLIQKKIHRIIKKFQKINFSSKFKEYQDWQKIQFYKKYITLSFFKKLIQYYNISKQLDKNRKYTLIFFNN